MIDDGQAIHYAAVQRGTPVYSSDEVLVGKVDAVLDNYREHAVELGNLPPVEPLIFLKPPSAVIGPEEPIVLPPVSKT